MLVSQIEEVSADIGEPDCKLVNPGEVTIDEENKFIVSPWMHPFTKETVFKISSDKILALTDPSPTLLEIYIDFSKE